MKKNEHQDLVATKQVEQAADLNQLASQSVGLSNDIKAIVSQLCSNKQSKMVQNKRFA